MPGDTDLDVTDDTVTLILRDGMLPRGTVAQLDNLLSGIRVAEVGPPDLPAVPGELRVIDADVPTAVYDEWRRLVILPKDLSLVDQGRVMRRLFAERRGEVLA